MAKKYENTNVDLEDLVSIGTIGLIKGINTYKGDKQRILIIRRRFYRFWVYMDCRTVYLFLRQHLMCSWGSLHWFCLPSDR